MDIARRLFNINVFAHIELRLPWGVDLEMLTAIEWASEVTHGGELP